VLFLLKTTPKPKKNKQYQNTKSEHFMPSLMHHGAWYSKTKTKPKPIYLFWYQKVAKGTKTKAIPNVT
jgi:hypothetical protein